MGMGEAAMSWPWVPRVARCMCHLPDFADLRPKWGADNTEKFPPKRQQLRRERASLLLCIKEEVVKQINAGFLEVCNYSEWVANIVPVEKKDGRVRVCVDYRDLNKASPKDNFPLPHID
ncbi:hypothetical protein CRG98_009113, partial [Punica granatum]